MIAESGSKEWSVNIKPRKLTTTLKKTAIDTSCFYIVKGSNLYKPINRNVAKPCEKWELSQSNKEQKIVVLA